ncbi:UNKNOWN [Stylonychia lemnae]|uniref:Uncharacterized protein n=1 Tax=Stylonychia lemnae TaxID=5949 RepID=A0A077ZRD7_STYLE|nr:UNKNOWN [Stylonychia lemnae]|eukprot:CDW71066.1 UNKNOWN [Stylonychia lemnae]
MINRQNSKQTQSVISNTLSKGASLRPGGKPSDEPKIIIKTDREEYYQDEVVQGSVRMKFDRNYKDFITKLAFIYEENYVLFDEKTEQALVTKDHKIILDVQELHQKEIYEPGEHFFQFGIQLPDSIRAGTFYHSGKQLSAKITYKIQIKIIEKYVNENMQEKFRVFKENLSVKINVHQRYVTIKKLVHNESTINKFLCFGGGRTSLQCEYSRDTYCIDIDRMQSALSQSQYVNTSVASYHSVGKDDASVEVNQQNAIEVRLTVNNNHNTFKVDEVVVQLIQVIAVKEDDIGRRKDVKKVLKHVQENLFIQHQPGVLAKDHTDHPRVVRINLSKVFKLVMKRQQEEGIYGKLSKTEMLHSKGIQQTSEGEYIDNFYILRVKALVNNDTLNSPYVDQQLFFCNHEVPDIDMNESQMKNIGEMHRNYVHEQFEKGEIGSVVTRTHSVAFQGSIQNEDQV